VAPRVGSGKNEAAILAALDGVPRDVRELSAELLGPEWTTGRYNSLTRAARNLAAHGLVKLTHVPRGPGGGIGPPRAYVLKVGRWVRDGDGGSSTDAEQAPFDWQAELVARAWQAFGSDYHYAEAIAAAAVRLMSRTEQMALTARQVRDEDKGSGTEAQPALRVLAVEVPRAPAEPSCPRVVDPVAAWLRGEVPVALAGAAPV
jgi:hypothetical protein